MRRLTQLATWAGFLAGGIGVTSGVGVSGCSLDPHRFESEEEADKGGPDAGTRAAGSDGQMSGSDASSRSQEQEGEERDASAAESSMSESTEGRDGGPSAEESAKEDAGAASPETLPTDEQPMDEESTLDAGGVEDASEGMPPPVMVAVDGGQNGPVDLLDNLVLFLPMEESSWGGADFEVEDRSGQRNHGRSMEGATTTPDGKFGRGGELRRCWVCAGG